MKLTEIRIDGYKNLIKCNAPLEGFNVIVGPNNSGKSNFLEVFQILGTLCFGGEQERGLLFQGLGFPNESYRGFSIPRLSSHTKNRQFLKIGVTFDDEPWTVNYDMIVDRAATPTLTGFHEETLTGKPVSNTGPARKFIHRLLGTASICGRSHQVEQHTSALLAFSVLYPETKRHSQELKQLQRFIDSLLRIARTDAFALSPFALRRDMCVEVLPTEFKASSFHTLAAIDKIAGDKSTFALFRETVCDVLDLESVTFTHEEIVYPRGSKDKRDVHRLRFCRVEKKCGDTAHLWECSDGTLVVFALVAAMLGSDKKRIVTCIEELENCLHPRAIQKLLKFLQDQSSKRQVIITTHSPYLLNGVEPSSVLVAVVDDTGATHFEKPTNRKALSAILKSKYVDFGDLLVTNFEEVLTPRDSQ